MEFGLEEPKKTKLSSGWLYERYNHKWHIPEQSLNLPIRYGDNIFEKLITAKNKEEVDFQLALDSIYFAKNVEDIENLIQTYPHIFNNYIIRKPIENKTVLEYLLKNGCKLPPFKNPFA